VSVIRLTVTGLRVDRQRQRFCRRLIGNAANWTKGDGDNSRGVGPAGVGTSANLLSRLSHMCGFPHSPLLIPRRSVKSPASAAGDLPSLRASPFGPTPLERKTSSGRARGHFFVRTQYLAESLDQMRNGTPLSLAAPPEEEDVSPTGCPPAAQPQGCPWGKFVQSLQRAIDPHFTVAQSFPP
jgi:hypothetical protein